MAQKKEIVCGKAAATKGNYCHSCGARMDGGRDT